MPQTDDSNTDFVKILLDEPVADGELGFGVYADVLTNIILGSDTPFTIGIFGEWGTGKTTLMKMVEQRLGDHMKGGEHPKVIPVWFDPWRYERETDLILPLLNAIVDAAQEHDNNLGQALKEAFVKIGRGILSAARGFKVGVELDAVVIKASAEYDLDKTFKYWEDLLNTLPGSSEYEKAYGTLKATIDHFAKGDQQGPENKFVVFVDDLDRCLPEPALEVLEAVKVFLGFPGMVYVLGLNRTIIQKCVEIKYCRQGEKLDEHPYGGDLGDRYIKKIIQVPFHIPPGTKEEMDMLVEAIVSEEGLRDELQQSVDDYLPEVREEYRAIYEQLEESDSAIGNVSDIATAYLRGNPREIKRLLNAYIVSSRITRAQMADAPDDEFNPVIAMSLLVLRFLDEAIYERLAGDYTEQDRADLRARLARAVGVHADDGKGADDNGGAGEEPQQQG